MSYVTFVFDAQYSFEVAQAAAFAAWSGLSFRSPPGGPEIDWGANDPAPDLVAVNAACASFVAAGGIANQTKLAERVEAASLITNGKDLGKAFRAVVLLVLDEFNAHTDKINAILDAADAAVSLGTFKAAVAEITNQPVRTKQQLLAAIENVIGSGGAD